MVKFGEDGPRDLSAARALFDAACAAGSIDGCTNHGFMLMMGEAGPRDIARAAKLLDAACTANAPNACENMEVMPVDRNVILSGTVLSVSEDTGGRRNFTLKQCNPQR